MKLRNPGPVQPAPTLKGPAGELAETLGCWTGVASFTHWQLGSPGVVDGAEFHVGDPELGHIHLDGSAHIPLSGPIAGSLEDKGFGRTPYWSDAWITCPVRSSGDVTRASWMFELAYARIRGASDGELLDRIRSGAGLAAD